MRAKYPIEQENVIQKISKGDQEHIADVGDGDDEAQHKNIMNQTSQKLHKKEKENKKNSNFLNAQENRRTT